MKERFPGLPVPSLKSDVIVSDEFPARAAGALNLICLLPLLSLPSLHPGKATSDLRTRNFRVQRLGERHAYSRKLRSRQEWTNIYSVHSL